MHTPQMKKKGNKGKKHYGDRLVKMLKVHTKNEVQTDIYHFQIKVKDGLWSDHVSGKTTGFRTFRNQSLQTYEALSFLTSQKVRKFQKYNHIHI